MEIRNKETNMWFFGNYGDLVVSLVNPLPNVNQRKKTEIRIQHIDREKT